MRTHLIFQPDPERTKPIRTACGKDITRKTMTSRRIDPVDCKDCERNYRAWKLQAGAPNPGLRNYHYEEV